MAGGAAVARQELEDDLGLARAAPGQAQPRDPIELHARRSARPVQHAPGRARLHALAPRRSHGAREIRQAQSGPRAARRSGRPGRARQP